MWYAIFEGLESQGSTEVAAEGAFRVEEGVNPATHLLTIVTPLYGYRYQFSLPGPCARASQWRF